MLMFKLIGFEFLLFCYSAPEDNAILLLIIRLCVITNLSCRGDVHNVTAFSVSVFFNQCRYHMNLIDPLNVKLVNLNFHPLEVVSR